MLKISKDILFNILEERFQEDLNKSLKTLPQPFVFKDMQKAAKRIVKAIQNKEKIAIVGDYDVDGIVSTTIIDEFFSNLGVNVKVKIPNRFKDGYGINESIIDELDADLIITVDNGISAFSSAQKCKDLNIDLIITDHHMPSDVLPQAYAIVNPKREDCDFKKFANCEICGAQVAWWLCAAIKKELNIEYDLKQHLDLLGIAIVADMMSLNDLNRALVKQSIIEINKLNRPAFAVLKDRYKKKFFDYDSIPFLIAPLLNSSGRMDDANVSYEFLKSKDSLSASKLLDIIEKFNQDRKEEEKQSYEESLKYVDDTNVIVAYSNNWHKGILGIVAGRLAKNYNKISFVFNIEDGIAQGSARSIANIDILELLNNTNELLDNYGGHKSAAGLALKANKLDEFKEEVNKYCKNLQFSTSCDTNEVLGEIELDEIDMEYMDIISYFEPYGQGNPKPYFIAKNVIVKNIAILKEKHLRFNVCGAYKTFDAIYFNYEYLPKENDVVNIKFLFQKNYFKLNPTIQLNILDIY